MKRKADSQSFSQIYLGESSDSSDDESIFENTVVLLTVVSVVVATCEPPPKNSNLKGRPYLITRERATIASHRRLTGDPYFRASFRYTRTEMEALIGMIGPYYTKKTRSGPNGVIPVETALMISLRYCAGGSPYDLFPLFGTGYTSVFMCLWSTVRAIHACPELKIRFPSSHAEQRKIARGFQKKSKARFYCCIGCLDGMLVWTDKPTEEECEKMKCGAKRFMCGRKGKFGLNLQAVCDHKGRFIAFFILHPGSSSDLLSFIRSSLYKDLSTPGFLFPGLALFADLAYVNNFFIVVPFKNVGAGSMDDFNYFHSSVRIMIECAFGQLVFRWPILRRALSSRLTIKKQIALVFALAKLHNFAKDMRSIGDPDDDFVTSDAPAASAMEELRLANDGAVTADDLGRPVDLLDGGQHFDDLGNNTIAAHTNQRTLTRQALHQKIIDNPSLTRPAVSLQRNRHKRAKRS